MTAVVAAARELAEAGTPVFPCRLDKRPACPHGFKDAASNPSAAEALWHAYPGPLIGVPTGTASGFDVLDIDPRHQGDEWWFANANRIPPTRMHRTRSGGLHVLFHHSESVRNTAGKLGTGVDTRGEGGYIIWWPAHECQVADAEVTRWPQWLLNRLTREPKQATSTEKFTALDSTGAAERKAERLIDRVKRAGDGEKHYMLRNCGLVLGGILHGLSMSEGEAARRLLAAVTEAGVEDAENARKTAEWAVARGKTKPLPIRGRA